MIGSGTLVPDAARGPSGHLVECGGISIALDLGFGALHRLIAHGVDHADLDAVAISHRHQDHIADLVPLLFATNYRPDRVRDKPLTLIGYAGLADDLSRLASIFGAWAADPAAEVSVVEATRPVMLECGDARVEVRSVPVAHTPEAVGYRLETTLDGETRVLAYSGDTEPCDGIVELAQNADLLVIECSMPDDEPVPGHMTPPGVGSVAAEAGANRIVVCHVYPQLRALGEAAIVARIAEFYDGPIDVGHDGWRIDL